MSDNFLLESFVPLACRITYTDNSVRVLNLTVFEFERTFPVYTFFIDDFNYYSGEIAYADWYDNETNPPDYETRVVVELYTNDYTDDPFKVCKIEFFVECPPSVSSSSSSRSSSSSSSSSSSRSSSSSSTSSSSSSSYPVYFNIFLQDTMADA